MQSFVLTLILSINSSSEVAFSNDWQLQMLKSVNKLRTDKGLSSLILCKPLASSAQNYAQAMAGQNFCHTQARMVPPRVTECRIQVINGRNLQLDLWSPKILQRAKNQLIK